MGNRGKLATCVLMVTALGACKDDGRTQPGTTSGIGDGGSATTDGGDGDGDGGGDGGDRLDVSGGSATQGSGEGGDVGCRGVDFLFVIDNSGSMADEQQNLINSFPGFVSSIETKLAELNATDFHILVTDTDAATIPPPNPACTLECAAAPPGTTCTADGSPCELLNDPFCLITCTTDPNGMCATGLSCADLINCTDQCDCSLGAGLLHDQNGAACPVDGGSRYIQDGQANLPGVFECLARVGTSGSGGELQAQGLIQALGNEHNGVGGCNEAFMRDDALLVVTLITDEEDSPDDPAGSSPGDPAGWHASVVSAKKGEESGIVMLGLVGDSNTPGAVCTGFDGNNGGEESPRLREFVSSFTNHVLGSVCEPDYTDFFQQAVDLIQTTCEDFVPPG